MPVDERKAIVAKHPRLQAITRFLSYSRIALARVKLMDDWLLLAIVYIQLSIVSGLMKFDHFLED